MDDTFICPICNNKLRNINLDNKFIIAIHKYGNFVERTCAKGMNHIFQILTDKSTSKINFINLSLNHNYSRYLEIDFVNQKCRIHCMKNGNSEYIDIPKIIWPDFPDLKKLKERVEMYIIFN